MQEKNKDSELLLQLLHKLNEVVRELQEIKSYVAVSAFLESETRICMDESRDS